MSRKGFSIIEFIVASTLTLGVLMASGTALSSTERGMANSRSVDTGAAIGVSVLEQTALFNCQRTTDLSTTTLGSLEIVCASVYGEENAVEHASFAGDFIYKKIVNGTDFIVEVSSAWLYSKTSQTQSGLTPSNSGNSGSSPATCPSVQASYSAFRQPSILSREVTVSWSTARNGYVSRKYISLESHYREDKDNPKGSLILQVPQGFYAVLKSTTNPSDKPVARKSVCTTSTGGAEILFPYLAPGDYTYSVFPILSSQDILSAQNRLDTFKSTILSPSLPVTVSSSTNKICTNTGVCS